MQEPSKPHDPANRVDAPKPTETARVPDAAKSGEPSNDADKQKARDSVLAGPPPRPDAPKLVSTLKPADQHPAASTGKSADPAHANPPKQEPPKSEQAHTAASHVRASSSLIENPARALPVAAVATAALIAVIWSFLPATGDQGSLADTRSKLTSVTAELKSVRDEKAVVDKALADTQAKLAAEQKLRSAAEKAVVEAKSALNAVALPASSGAAEKGAEPPKAAAPK